MSYNNAYLDSSVSAETTVATGLACERHGGRRIGPAVEYTSDVEERGGKKNYARLHRTLSWFVEGGREVRGRKFK